MLDIKNLHPTDLSGIVNNISEKKNSNLNGSDGGKNPVKERSGFIGNIFTDENTMQEFGGEDFFKEHNLFKFREETPFYDDKNEENQEYTQESSDDLDGEIDSSKQSDETGDCWLLTGLNSLSYSEAGTEAIKNAMTFNDDGSVTISFKGLETSYTVSAQELAGASGDDSYSSGDDDVLAFELATEKLRNDIASGKIQFSSNSPNYVRNTTSGNNGTKSIEGGYTEQVYYLLTGKLSETSSDSSEIETYLDNFQNNSDTAAMSCSINGEGDDTTYVTVKDASGQTIKLYNSHAYAVKSVDDETVTIVNPWDSTQEIVLSRDNFSEIMNVSYCDISDESKDYSGVFQKATKFVKDRMGEIFGKKNGEDEENKEFDILDMMMEDMGLKGFDIFNFKHIKKAS